MQDKILRLGQPTGAQGETVAEVKRDDIVVSDVPVVAVQPETTLVTQNISKLKKHQEKEHREKNLKTNSQKTNKNFFGRLFG